jgi:beta-lactamase regulating signal transducer with metallopeptidase domain
MDAVLNWLWQGCVVAVASFVMLHVLERASANLRCVVCWAALLLIVVLPVLPLQPTAPSPEALSSTRGDAIVSLPDAWWTSSLGLFAVWIAWASVWFVRFVSAIVVLRRARARSRAFPSHVEAVLPHWTRVRFEGRGATVVLSDSVTTAAVLGWGAPMIAVTPSLVGTLDAGELDRVLIHEWAHVQRRDDIINLLQIVIRIMIGWHPAVWWIERRLQVEREVACDEMTVAISGSPKSYAQCLMKLASLRGTGRAMQAAPAVFTASGLRRRVAKIVSPHPLIAPVWSRSIAAAIVFTLFAMSVGVGGLQLVEVTAFGLPVVSTRTIGTTLDRLAPIAVPTRSRHLENKRTPRQITGSPRSTQRVSAEAPSRSPLPKPEPDALLMSRPVNAVDARRPAAEAEDHDGGAGGSKTPTVLPAPGLQPSDPTVEQPRSPWTAAADGGTALGRKSKDAAVATAGFFTRFARRVAGSF